MFAERTALGFCIGHLLCLTITSSAGMKFGFNIKEPEIFDNC